MTYLEECLIKDPETVKQDHKSLLNTQFLAKYKCSSSTVLRFLWPKSDKPEIDITVVLKLIKEWKTNVYIANELWCSDCRISQIRKKLSPTSEKYKVFVEPRGIMETSHETPKEHTIEVKGDLVEIWLRPMQWIVFNKNSLQFYNKIL